MVIFVSRSQEAKRLETFWILFCNKLCLPHIKPYQSSFLFPLSTECLFLIKIHSSLEALLFGKSLQRAGCTFQSTQWWASCDVLNSLKENGNSLTATNACGANAVLLSVSPQLVNEVSRNPWPRGCKWVTEGNRSSAGVELLQGDVQRLLEGQSLRCECLVDLHLEICINHHNTDDYWSSPTWSTSPMLTPVFSSMACG